MRLRNSLLLMAIILLSGQVAQAQTVNTPNAMVFYFDEESTQRSWYGTGEVTVYLTVGPLFNTNQPGYIPFNFLNAWSCYGLTVYPMEHVSSAVLYVRGLAEEDVPFPLGSASGDFSFNLLYPIPLDGRTIVAELRLNVISTEPTMLSAWGTEFTADDTLDYFWMLTTGPDGPMDMTGHSANINADAPVSSVQTSFGSLKALFR